jgi:hypothetical protein
MQVSLQIVHWIEELKSRADILHTIFFGHVRPVACDLKHLCDGRVQTDEHGAADVFVTDVEFDGVAARKVREDSRSSINGH